MALAAGILFIPLPWLISWLLAAAIHELFHILIVYLVGEKVVAIRFGVGGAIISSTVSVGIKAFLCSLAGPAAGFVLLILLHRIPRIALCGLVQSVYNLLPIRPLDGGHALKNFFLHFWGQKSLRGLKVIERTVLCVLTILGIIVVIKWNISLIILVSAILFLKNKKYLANNSPSEYNMLNIK